MANDTEPRQYAASTVSTVCIAAIL
jgi:hypothetical protein